ncbi:MAG: major facilitator superfamily domain-containing protein 6 [Wenzhouxiangellaceae bacterium]
MDSHPPSSHRPLAGYYFTYYAVLGLFSPYFSLYLDELRLSPVTISSLMSIWFASRLFFPNWWAWKVDASAHPTAWLRWGCVAAGLSMALLLLPVSVPLLAIALAGFSLLFNAMLPQFETITFSHLGPRGADYGRIRLWGSLGFVIMAVLGGPLFSLLSLHWLPVAMAVLIAVTAITAWQTDYGPWHGERGAAPWREVMTQLRQRPVIAFLLAALLMHMAHGPYYVFYSLHLEAAGYSRDAIGSLWALGVVAEILLFYYARPLLLRVSAARLAQFCLLLAALRWWLIATQADSVLWMTLAQTGHAATFAAFHLAAMQLINRFFPHRLLIHGQGLLYGFSAGLGGLAGGLGSGWIWQWGGGQATFLFAAGAAVLGLLIATSGIRPRYRSETPTASAQT